MVFSNPILNILDHNLNITMFETPRNYSQKLKKFNVNKFKPASTVLTVHNFFLNKSFKKKAFIMINVGYN